MIFLKIIKILIIKKNYIIFHFLIYLIYIHIKIFDNQLNFLNFETVELNNCVKNELKHLE